MTTTNTNDQARKYLIDAIYNARSSLYRDIDKACHIEPVRPDTPSKLVEWIKADKFRFDPDIDPNEPMHYWGDVMQAITFNEHEADHVKRKASYKKLDEEYEALKLRINVLDPEKTIKEVEDFKKKTYH